MGLLDRFGLGPKPGRRPRRAAGLRLEGRANGAAPGKMSGRDIAARVALIAVLAALAMVAFPRTLVYNGDIERGEVWMKEDVVAPFDFGIQLPEAMLQAQRDSVRRAVPPIFVERPEATERVLARLDTLDALLDSTFAAYVAWQRASQGEPAVGASPGSRRADSLRFRRRADAVPLDLSRDQWRALLGSASAQARVRSSGLALDDRLLGEVGRVTREVHGDGVIDVPMDSVAASQLVVRNLDPRVRTERELSRATVLDRDGAREAAERSFEAAFPFGSENVELAGVFFDAAFEPNLLYQSDATQTARQDEIAAVQPNRGQVRENAVVIRRGDVVTAERYQMLQSLYAAQRARAGDISYARMLLGRVVLVVCALALFFLYLYLLRRQIFGNLRRLILVGILLGVVLIGFGIAAAFGAPAARYAVPVGLVSILLSIAFDSRVGVFATMTLAFLAGMIFGSDFELAFATLFAGVLAVFSVRDIKNRSQLLFSAGLVLAAYALVVFAYALLRSDPFGPRLAAELIAVAAHAVLLLLAAPLLLAIERGFGITTDLTLLELSDTNRPVLKELSLRAPGTFNHSLQVANLAEAAADAIGANALRTRVGALYHDIGKMLKPEYFIENQQPGENPHEKLKPSMSALVLMAHVKDGLELGRENNLPRVVRDFVATHHGTGLMSFFYRRAQELQGEEGAPVDEADFRYPGPRPRTNEEAIVMLADSVEAASRSLEKPTPRRLEALIDGIFADRVADGQLDESRLTFSDLARIKETFHGLLCGIYHFRIKYPDQSEAEETADGAPPPGLDVRVPQNDARAPVALGERQVE